MDFATTAIGGSLALVRISAVVCVAPILGNRSVPLRFKAALALVLTTVTFPLLEHSTIPVMVDGWFQSLFSELAIGIALGLGVKIVFTAAQMTGGVISHMAAIQIGDGNDTLGGEGSPVSKLFGALSIATFVLLGGPELLVGALIDTFVAVPVGASLQPEGLVDLIIRLLRQSFLLTLRGVAPAVGTMLISTIVVGLIGRNYPQFNLLSLGLTSNLGVMMLATMLTLGGCVWLFADDLQYVLTTIQTTIADSGELTATGPLPIQNDF